MPQVMPKLILPLEPEPLVLWLNWPLFRSHFSSLTRVSSSDLSLCVQSQGFQYLGSLPAIEYMIREASHALSFIAQNNYKLDLLYSALECTIPNNKTTIFNCIQV
jgi:hypothetical protein